VKRAAWRECSVFRKPISVFPIRKKSHGSEEFLRSYELPTEDLPKGTIWRKDPVTFRGTSHPIYAPRFVGVNSNVNGRKVHKQDDSQVDGMRLLVVSLSAFAQSGDAMKQDVSMKTDANMKQN
jgi:hypothetical protein